MILAAGKLIPPVVASILLIAATAIHPQLNPEQQRQLQQWQQYQQFQAQVHQQAIPVDPSAWTTSYWDLGQNIKIEEINKHFESTDGRVTKMEDAHAKSDRELSDIEARSSVWFSILGAGVLGAIGLAANNFLKLKDKH
jgi:hypothetical protein